MRVQVRIKEVAEQQGITVQKLAEKAHVPQSTMQKLFDEGNAETISIGTLARIAEALGAAFFICSLLRNQLRVGNVSSLSTQLV
jgi:DNA-binding Xre family transcriptional regulator